MEYGELGKRVRRSLQKIVPELFHRIMIIEDQDNDRVDVEFDLGELETSIFGEDYVLKGDAAVETQLQEFAGNCRKKAKGENS